MDDDLNFYHSSVGSSLPKPWWFHVEVKSLITLTQRLELLPYTAVLLETAVLAALAGGGEEAAVTAVVLTPPTAEAAVVAAAAPAEEVGGEVGEATEEEIDLIIMSDDMEE